MEKNGPYLMYANAKGETHGLWFPEEASLETIRSELHACVEKIQAGNQSPRPKQQPQPQQAVSGVKVAPRPKQQSGNAGNATQLARTPSEERAHAAAAIMSMVGLNPAGPTPPQVRLTC
eukprot:TRINITY_DN13044_c0_g1_i5.p4 TRINITY_DN13044_c0_g1~~TRINITY_DN13044_c0_g1_i5.p4  ORF type:complete len:119 (+),score=31.15 TRINITY_DN13044_c0_g1_i5:377-733(+)